jgi:hypothetical protein
VPIVPHIKFNKEYLERLALRLCGTAKAEYVESEEVWYLGAGYWRAEVNKSDDGEVSINLINPSLSASQIDIVEQAFGIIHF